MDLSAGLTLLNLFTMDFRLQPSTVEMEKRYQEEHAILHQIWDNASSSIPRRKDEPAVVISMVHIDHIRGIDQSKGTMSLSLSFTFTWMDERLHWDPALFSGVKSINNERVAFGANLWIPEIQVADMPNAGKSPYLFVNPDVEMSIEHTGTVKAYIKTLLTTPCYFGFGDYPNDYQNCSFTLFTPYYADEFQFNDWSAMNAGKYANQDVVPDTDDFMLIGVDSRSYAMYMGFDIVKLNKRNAPHSRNFIRYTVMLKRMNKLVHVHLSAPMVVISVLVGMSGILPDQQAVVALLSAVGFLMMFAMQISDVLPDDFNGMPMTGMMTMFLMVETISLLAYKMFSIYTRKRKLKALQAKLEDPMLESYYEHVKKIDRILAVILVLQGLLNVYLARRY